MLDSNLKRSNLTDWNPFMDKKEFENQLKNNPFFKQIMAEMSARHEELRQATTDTITMIATATARQMDADLFVQNLERMDQMFSRQAPNALRSEMVRLIISLVHTSGTPHGQDH